MVIKKVLTFLLIFLCEICYAENSIIAVVNDNVITLRSIEFDIVNQKINNILQLKKAKELNIEASLNDVNLALLSIAEDNNISIEQLRSYPEFISLKIQVLEKISIHNLQRMITRDIITPEKEFFNACFKEDNNKSIKQIRVAQIIISEVKAQNDQDAAIKTFLKKLSKHITKGASFEGFARLHSQHFSYLNGGVTDWIEVDNPIVVMLDSLKDNEVSKIYLTDFGLAIGIKLEERFVSSNFKQCKEKLLYLNAEKFYSNWVKGLREQAYIKIYHDAL